MIVWGRYIVCCYFLFAAWCHAVSVYVSVCHVVDCVKTNKCIFKIFLPPTAWQYSDGNPPTRVSIASDNRRGLSRGNKNVGCGTWKRRFLALAVRITGKLLQIGGYMLRGVWQALNCLFIHATYCVIIAGASPGKTEMWAAVRENDAFLHLRR